MRDGDGFGYFLDFGYFYHCLCLRNVIIRIIISLMLGGEYLGAGWGWVWRGQLVATPPLCQSLEILLNIINIISHHNVLYVIFNIICLIVLSL